MPHEFYDFREIDIEKLKKEVEEDRKRVLDILMGNVPEKVKDLVKTVLFIVESPNKARTIASFFGKPSRRKIGKLDVYETTIGDKVLMIVATKGHIFDITTEEIPNAYYGVIREGPRFIPFYTTIKRCKKCGYQWTAEVTDTCPRCGASKEYIEDSRDRIEALKKLAEEADVILIGTDPDSVTGKMKVRIYKNNEIIEDTIENIFEKLKKEYKTFEIDEHEYIDLNGDIEIDGVDPLTLRIKKAKVKYIIRHKVKRKIYRIRTSSYEIEVTGDHSLFKLENLYYPLEIDEGKIPGQNISVIIDENILNEILKDSYLLNRFLRRAPLREENIEGLLSKVSGVLSKVYLPNLKTTIPIYFYGVDKEGKKYFSLILKRRSVLKEVRAREIKEGDKIVVIKGNRVLEEEVKEIEVFETEDYVYDFDTETDNFIANNVLCHNTEGEFIAWSVYLSVKPFSKEMYRAEFHEVTKKAILDALNNLREINMNRVKAQIVRRVEDRWIGFALSKKVQNLFRRKTLSAGRVQTPVLGWIIDRFVEHRKSIQYFINLSLEDFNLIIEELEIKDYNKLKEVIEKLKKDKVVLEKVEFWEEEVNPLPPYITNTMLNDAIRYLKLGAKDIMQLAQDLFELGLITYHRTDSTRVSPVGIALAKEYISEKFGEEYYKGRTWGEGGAHECIRPTKPYDPETLQRMIYEGELTLARPITRNHIALYSLIFNRFIASQMIPVKVKKAKYIFKIPSLNLEKEIEGVVEIVKDGWNLVLPYPLEQQKIKKIDGKEFEIKEITYWKGAKVRLYTQADVISLMREKKIGRPSTYAQIVQKLLDRRYVIETKNKRLVPTPLGIKVYTFLNYKYGKLVSEDRTRELEEKMDMIEEGKVDYQEVLRETYDEMMQVETSKDDFNELRRILGSKFESFRRNVRLKVIKRKVSKRFRRYKLR